MLMGLALGVLATVAGPAVAQPASKVTKFAAHRGGALLWPENSLLAFRSAAENLGADFLEFDVHLSKDDQVVVIHDPTLERTTIRPTLDVNGMWSGYTGEGSKTVLPSFAAAKVSMRLVPDQEHVSGRGLGRGQGGEDRLGIGVGLERLHDLEREAGRRHPERDLR